MCVYGVHKYNDIYDKILQRVNKLTIFLDRSLMAKKADGVKESTDSSTTIEDDDVRGEGLRFVYTC